MKKSIIGIVIIIILVSSLFIYNKDRSETDDSNIKTHSIKEIYSSDYKNNDGTMYENVSNNFDYKIYPFEIKNDGEFIRITYKVSVYNKSDNDYKRARLLITLDDNMFRFIASEVTQYPLSEIDLLSVNSTVNEQDIYSYVLDGEISVMLKTSEHESISKYFEDSDFLASAEKINIKVEWEGGSEEQEFNAQYIMEESS